MVVAVTIGPDAGEQGKEIRARLGRGQGPFALLLVGFVAALRRSELASVEVDQLGHHPRGSWPPSLGPEAWLLWRVTM
ncbi:MAG TPA: hypothetical protein VE152_13150 [Acidimicrobiales bacterium]|nr:hypothetical protein [Acidimicrobiales bacterium]